MPTFAYFLSTTGDPIDRDHPLWHRSLPQGRAAGSTPSDAAGIPAVTYGTYFSSILSFCAADGWSRIRNALGIKLSRPIADADLIHLSVFLEKHGAYYHPARLQVSLEDRTVSFVVNVAASPAGRRTLPGEVQVMNRLARQCPFGWFPRLYGAVFDDLPMVLGDWLDGFHEFHLSRQFGGDEPAIVVWNGAAHPCPLSDPQAASLYRNAAMILTACYDPISTCQIFPWHHAAGDFVVCTTGERSAVRLITVRDYPPIAESATEPNNERTLMDALVFFFIHLSVRMRLDRLDGVGDIAWAPASCLVPLIEGFFQGLDLSARLNGLPETFPEVFRHYFNRYDRTALLTTAQRITASVFDRHSEERRVTRIHQDRHMREIRRLLAA